MVWEAVWEAVEVVADVVEGRDVGVQLVGVEEDVMSAGSASP